MTSVRTVYVKGPWTPPLAPPEPPADGHLLEYLAAMTSLLSPERMWHQEELLDELNESQADEKPMSAQQETRALAAE